LNQISLYLETRKNKPSEALLSEIKWQLEKLPPSRLSVYAAINFVNNFTKLSKLDGNESVSYQESAQILARALRQAQ
ncbi:hypothetical protein, partial [Trichormus variabilis]|uniref:hypothetical protein n=1 Tax=Anabaena variabilis TaxID=264691 RepID=UPI001A9176B8